MTRSRRFRTAARNRAAVRFFGAWLGWVSLGESLGFLAPVLLQQLGSKNLPGMMLPLLVIAGLLEGALLGWSQAHVLKRRLPALSVRRWTLLTALAAAVAWLLGLAPSEFSGVWMAWPPALQSTVGLLGGVALLASIGSAQWLELRRHLHRGWLWIPGTATAWTIGLVIFFVISTPLWEPGQNPVLIALIGTLAGTAMAIGTAIVTGLVIVSMTFDASASGALSA